MPKHFIKTDSASCVFYVMLTVISPQTHLLLLNNMIRVLTTSV